MIIQAKHLTRDFKIYKAKSSFHMLNQILRRKGEIKRVVDEVDLEIQEGEFVGYLGPNGAGKSTTIKMLSGVLQPTLGEISVLGLNPTKDRKKYAQQIGVLYGQRTQLWWDLPLCDSFDLLKAIYNIPQKDFTKRLHRFIELLDMQEFINQPVRQLSLGQRMKGEMVAALIHNPRILFLDEPTIGLDVLAKDRIQEFLAYINKEEKVTVMLTSHNMDDVERLCKRIILIDQGKVKFDGTKEALRDLVKQSKFLILEVSADDMRLSQPLPYAPFKMEENRLFFEVMHDAEISQIIAASAKTHSILKVDIEEPKIDSILKELYQSKNYQAEAN
ncbi:ATP-binding cassette domain-containing protein [Paenibacillus sp.]|jgi:ABC-2 type transport system ATP-binding protein|uniref:ABC transporter ATP-binding protein n=1 Tax=Paenibacillus sp. TaxID=58172 RepID=UPI002821F0A1|nr:ATP-binding cassette domain-containing protein [Paenibacillus sp.]MDR0267455.1 ATP-binding cassette domain-containing protein [Paenibacillus sp.]